MMSDRLLQLMLIDDDPQFRLGLRFWLNGLSDLTVIAESANGADALEQLTQPLATQALEAVDAVDGSSSGRSPSTLVETLNLVILNLGLGRADPTQMQGLTLCETLRQRHPQLPILGLSALGEPLMVAAARQAGATGFCLRSVEIDTLKIAIQQTATCTFDWQAIAPLSPDSIPSQSPQSFSPQVPSSQVPSPLALLRRRLRQQSLQEIDAAIADLAAQLQLDLSLLDRAVLAGRYRELRASRWLVQRLLVTPALPNLAEQRPLSRTTQARTTQARTTQARTTQARTTRSEFPTEGSPSDRAIAPAVSAVESVGTTSPVSLLDTVPTLNTVIDAHRLQALLFDQVLSKIQSHLNNQTDTPLEVDILRDDKKRELFYLVLRKFEDLLNDLRYSQVQPEQLIEKRSPILIDLWQAITTDFIGKYYTISLEKGAIEVVPSLLQTVEMVQVEILDKLPCVTDLLAHLLFQTPLWVNGTPYAAGNPESLARADVLFENLLIQLANSVIYPLLNQFPNVEQIKQDFYDRRLMSNREIERFRNNLSWRYRLERIITEPTDIFESQHRLVVFHPLGIKQVTIYAPRNQELDNLAGVQLLVTLALETRDAIAPRLRSAASIVGSGLVYVLTEVIGRGIGLIGRGVLKGVGYWQVGDRRKDRR